MTEHPRRWLALALVVGSLVGLSASLLGGLPSPAPFGHSSGLRVALNNPPKAVTSNNLETNGAGGNIGGLATAAHDSIYVGILTTGSSAPHLPQDSLGDAYHYALGKTVGAFNLTVFYTDNVASSGSVTVFVRDNGNTSSELDAWDVVMNGTTATGSLGALGNAVTNSSGTSVSDITTKYSNSMVLAALGAVRPLGTGFVAPSVVISTGSAASAFGTNDATQGANQSAATPGFYQSTVTSTNENILLSVEVASNAVAGPPTCSITSASNPSDVGSVTFTGHVTGGTSPFTYQWGVNATGTVGTSNPQSVTFSHATGYTVYLNVTDSLSNVGRCVLTQGVLNHPVTTLTVSNGSNPSFPSASCVGTGTGLTCVVNWTHTLHYGDPTFAYSLSLFNTSGQVSHASGNYATSTLANVSGTFGALHVGIYVAFFNVTDSNGFNGSATLTFSIVAPGGGSGVVVLPSFLLLGFGLTLAVAGIIVAVAIARRRN